MLVCLQINLSLDGHLTYQHCNPQAVSVVPSGQPPNKPTLYLTANVHSALRMPGTQLNIVTVAPCDRQLTTPTLYPAAAVVPCGRPSNTPYPTIPYNIMCMSET